MWENEKPRQDKAGNRWNFHYWHNHMSVDRSLPAQRLFFWSDDQSDCGVLLFPPGKTVPYTRIRNIITKLVADPNFRQEHHRALEFPLKNHYSDYPAFPEEFTQ